MKFAGSSASASARRAARVVLRAVAARGGMTLRRVAFASACALAPASAATLTAADLGPIVLTRPIAPSTLERLADEAAAIYRSGNAAQALEAYRTLADLDASRPLAWLRIGNLHQQAGRRAQALEAYARAVPSAADPVPDAEVTGKALFNIASLGFEQVSEALDRLATLDVAEDVASAVDALRVQMHESLAGLPVASAATRAAAGAGPREPHPAALREPRAASSSAVAPSPVARPALREPFEPYTVDRWTGRAAAAPRATRARGGVGEPLTLDPLPPRPVVEYIQGAPARPVAR